MREHVRPPDIMRAILVFICHLFISFFPKKHFIRRLSTDILAVFSKRQRITLRLLYAMSRPSVVCLSVCDVGAPYSGG